MTMMLTRRLTGLKGSPASSRTEEDKAGTDESVRMAREWVAANGSHLNASPPTVSDGPASIYFTQG